MLPSAPVLVMIWVEVMKSVVGGMEEANVVEMMTVGLVCWSGVVSTGVEVVTAVSSEEVKLVMMANHEGMLVHGAAPRRFAARSRD